MLALEHGRPGERYLLGGVDLTMRELFAAVARLAGRPRPRLAVPYAAIRAGAALGLVNRNEAILARTPAYFSWAKAARELGYRPGPVEPALARAVGGGPQCFLSFRDSVPSPITARKISPTISMPVMTSRPSVAASASSASTGASLTHAAGVQGESPVERLAAAAARASPASAADSRSARSGPLPSSTAVAAQASPSPGPPSARSWAHSEISAARSATASTSSCSATRTSPCA